jgi:hypothetical protein
MGWSSWLASVPATADPAQLLISHTLIEAQSEALP